MFRWPRVALLALALLASLLLAGCGALDAATVSNVAEYQIRKAFPPLLVYRTPPAPASLSGMVRDEAGQPIAGAVVLVSTVRGEDVYTRSDAQGRYRLEGITPGRVTPMAGAWGFDALNGPAMRLSPGQQRAGVDFTLAAHRPQPVSPVDLVIGQPVQESSQFPEPMIAVRIPFTFTLDGLRIDNGQIYLPALPDLPAMPPAIVDVGGVSDAFLGIQALYDAELAIPAPYDSAVAALGRPDRDPAYFYGFSPVFYADRLPPIFIIHTTNDEVIPANQAEALAAALAAAGAPHELLLYEDTTHYLDAYHPTPATRMVYERVLEFVRGWSDRMGSEGAGSEDQPSGRFSTMVMEWI